MDNLPKTSDKSTVKSTDKIVKDPKTGKDVIVYLKRSWKRKSTTRNSKQIDKENETENQRANGVQDGAQAGWNDGYVMGTKALKE